MVIKVYSSQATVSKQSPFVTNSKLDRNFGQDVFSGIRSIAQGVEAVGEFALQKKQLAQKKLCSSNFFVNTPPIPPVRVTYVWL